jgi:hypothetical protein
MKVLPDNVPLVRIQRFLHTSLQNMLAERRKAQMLKGLLYAEHLQVTISKTYCNTVIVILFKL